MLSIELLRRDQERVRRGLARRGESPELNRLLEMDLRHRQAVAEGDRCRAQRNEASRTVGALLRRGAQAEADAVREDVRRLGSRIAALDDETRSAAAEIRTMLLNLPNLPLDDVPEGKDESDNVVVRSVGTPGTYNSSLRPHWELAELLGVTDMQRGAKLSGSRFYLLGEPGARLQRAMITWMLDFHREQHGYREVAVPYLVRESVLVGAGNLPKFGDNLYRDTEDDLWLIPTAEVPLTGLHADEILEPGTLPLRYMAHSSCFRREKAAGGRDVRGIKRVHQFEKVEMYQLVAPEDSLTALRELLSHAEEVVAALGLPYRVLQICAGDLGFQSAATFDLEVWSPASQEWVEVSSCSNCTDFQARRANLRFRRSLGSRPEFPHTLNGSGLAVPRVLIALLETYQRSNGSVVVPTVLQDYLGLRELTPLQ